MKGWATAKLGDVLTKATEQVDADPVAEYSEVTVKLWGKGVVERKRVLGSEVNGRRFVARAGNFIASRIDARNGAMGLVPDSLDGALVTNDFPLFDAHTEKLDLAYLGWLCRTREFVELCVRASEGTTNRVRLKEERFLALEIPLPPLAEQRRIVARIEALAAQIDEAKRLRQEAIEEAEALLEGAASTLANRSSERTVTVDELVGADGLRNGKSVKSSPDENSPRCLTLSSMRNGRIDLSDSKPVPLSDREVETFAVRENDVFVVRGNGSKTLCGRAGRAEHDSPSTVFPDLFIRVDLPCDQIDPAFFTLVWNSRSTREVIEEKAKTTSGIWKINQGHILATPLPLPPLPEQRRIVAELDALQAEVDGMKRLQAETAAELDALLPAILDRAFKGEL